jgi:hypothetical protein
MAAPITPDTAVAPTQEITYVERQWAKKGIEKLLAREAHFESLKASLPKLTKDIKVGTQFISTNDYDGTLYECKQEPYKVLVSRSLTRTDDDKLIYYENEHIQDYSEQDMSSILFPGVASERHWVERSGWVNITDMGISQPIPSSFTQEIRDRSYGKEFEIPFVEVSPFYAQRAIIRRFNVQNEDPTVPPPTTATFHVNGITFEFRQLNQNKYQAAVPSDPWYMRTTAIGYWPQIEYESSRIWVRKSNLVAQALGKNVDASKKSIVFQICDMNVRDMVRNEIDKLTKLRKIYNKSNPQKARTATYAAIDAERNRIQPQIERLNKLYTEIYRTNLSVPAYYCAKYGYLIPIDAKIKVELDTKTVEQRMAESIVELNAQTAATINQLKEVINSIIPAAIHPARMEAALERYGMDGTLGEDVVVSGNGVVNHSVFG